MTAADLLVRQVQRYTAYLHGHRKAQETDKPKFASQVLKMAALLKEKDGQGGAGADAEAGAENL
jgi:hypothetical protein